MTKAIRIHQHGGPEVLSWDDVEVPEPGPGQVRVKHTAVGVNYIDTYHRSGIYPVPALPLIFGLEAAGVVEAVGEGVADLAAGDRVCYGAGPLGAYAEARVMPAAKLVKTPDAIDDAHAAAMMLQGMTVQYLIHRTFRVEAGMTVLFHAAAGGVGTIACQWLNHLGATVIGTVGSAEKAAFAKAHGCHHPIVYSDQDFVERVRELTDGKGVAVVYDGVGKTTFERSLDCIARRGMMVIFGNASGMAPTVDPMVLNKKGGLYLTRPSIVHYTVTREELVETADSLFAAVGSGAVTIEVGRTYPLSEAAQAHRELESRKTTGSSVLLT